MCIIAQLICKIINYDYDVIFKKYLRRIQNCIGILYNIKQLLTNYQRSINTFLNLTF